MGIRHDVKPGLEKYKITKIDGQPTDGDLNLLTKELTNAAGSIATENGGGEHGHVGMVIDEAEYITSPDLVPDWSFQRIQDLTQQPSMQTKSSVNVKSRNTRWNASHMKPTLALASKTTFAG
jgi:hypothetical protein